MPGTINITRMNRQRMTGVYTAQLKMMLDSEKLGYGHHPQFHLGISEDQNDEKVNRSTSLIFNKCFKC